MQEQDHLIPIIMGSKSDQEWANKIATELEKWNIQYKFFTASAHKVPELLLEIINTYNKSDKKICYITIAGRSNGLSGVTAANSIHPVIACPPFKDKLDMQVNINSTLQMPSNTPVLTILDPKNVAEAIIRILALDNKELKEKISSNIKKIKESFKN